MDKLVALRGSAMFRDRPSQMCGGRMIRISLAYPYDLGQAFARIRQDLVEGVPLQQARFALSTAEDELGGLFHPKALFSHTLRGAEHDANTLFDAIKKLTTDGDQSRKIDFFDRYSVISALERFETILRAELRAADSYFVSKKGGYDTIDFITQADVLFPSDLAIKAPEAVSDIREAGRCIAYELGTAAGFHLLRANEAVLLRYWDAVTNKAKRPRNRNLGQYIKSLTDINAGDPKVRATLQQIKDLHRNTLVHPEDVLTLDDAINLLGIIRSAIAAMLKAMPAIDPEVEPFVSEKDAEQPS